MTTTDTQATTLRLAEFALSTDWAELPFVVQHESTRALVNWLGCTLGGCQSPAAVTALEAAREFSGPPIASVVGHGRILDPINAAFINSLANSAYSFDDTHLATVTHPTGPVAAALLALAARQTVSGRDFLAALALGIEVECRLSNAILLPPAQGNVGWYVTGVTGGIGAALACARVMGLDLERTVYALGLAAAQAAGFRQTHATMTVGFVPAHAARCGLQAALLAERGFTNSQRILEGPNGFFDVFAAPANPAAAVEGLGSQWEMLTNAYKPYPCGIVIHPAIDACLDLIEDVPFDAASIAAVEVMVNPLCLTLCDRPEPADSAQASVSLQHWVAAALAQRAAGLPQRTDDCVHDPAVVAVRGRISATPDESVDRDAARVAVVLNDGRRFEREVEHCRGSLARPMSDADLDLKFLAQAQDILPEPAAGELLRACRLASEVVSVSALMGMSFVS